jgi:hypothetical protein
MTENRPATITTAQMRHLHGLLRDHGITGDKAIHDYLTVALAEAGLEPVTSRKDLPHADAARLITDLEAAEVARTATADALERLRRPFEPEAIGKLPRSTCRACSDERSESPGGKGTCSRHPAKGECRICGNYHNTAATMHIDYVGHADVTARLLEVDPHWTWTFVAQDPTGFPILDGNGGLWMNLTVLGVTRPGYGDPGKNKGRPDGMKEAIGDALRNAAMRFGIALDLWAKGDRDWANVQKDGAEEGHPDQAQPRQEEPTPPWTGPNTAALLLQLDEQAARAGVTYEKATANWRKARGNMTLDALDTVDPWHLAPLVDAVRKRADEVVAEREAAEKAAADADTTPTPGASGEQPPEA